MAKNVTRSETPTNRLERLCAAMTDALEQHPEYRPDDQAIIMLDSPAEKRGGLVTSGYDDGKDAAVNLLSHVEALFKAHGLDFTFVPIDRPGQG